MRIRWLSYSMIWLAIVLVVAYINPNHYQPWVAFHADWLAGLAFFPLLIWSATIRSKKPIPYLASLAFALGLFGVFQWRIGVINYFGDCAIQFCYLAGFGISIIAGRNFQEYLKSKNVPFEKHAALQGLWVSLIFAGILSSGIALYQVFELDYSAIFIMDIADRNRAYANLAQPNQLATLIALAIVSSIAIFQKKLIGRSTLIGIICVLTLALATTKSRSTILFFIIFFTYVLIYKKLGRSKISIALPVAIIFLFLLFSALIPELKDIALLNNGSTILGRAEVGSRIGILKMSLQALSLMSPFGYGANQIAQAQIATLDDNRPLHFVFESSHNLFMDLILNFGLATGILASVLIVCWLVKMLRCIHDSEAVALALVISTLGAHAMVEFPLNYSYFLLPMGFFVGQLDANIKIYRTNFSQVRSNISWFAKIGFTLSAVLLYIFVSLDYPKVESAWRDLRYSLAKIQGSSVDFSDRPIVYNQFNDVIEFTNITPHRNMPVSDLQRMKVAAQRFNLAATNFKYAVAAALNDRPEEAARTMLSLCKMQDTATCALALHDWNSYAVNNWPELLKIDISSATAVISHP